MTTVKVIRTIINLSSWIQTILINYLEFHRSVPIEPREKGYDSFSPGIEKSSNIPDRPMQKEDVIKPHYEIILRIKKERGIIINPVCRRHVPLRTKEKKCRKCKAPSEYLQNHGFYTRRSDGKKYPKHTCKVCLAEYAPGAKRKTPKHICVYCGYAMSLEHHRKNFSKYVCKQNNCDHKNKVHPLGYRYRIRNWNFDYDSLSTNDINNTHNLDKTRISKDVIDKELALYVECGVGSREAVKILSRFYGDSYVKSHQTILNHVNTVAEFIKENEEYLPVTLIPYPFVQTIYIAN